MCKAVRALVLCYVWIVWAPSKIFACDLCAVYSAQRASDAPVNSFQLGATERFTRFKGVARDFFETSDTFRNEQHLDSSVSQLYLQYQAKEWLSFQVNYPWIYREYRRVKHGRLQDGDEYGFGDLTLLAQFQPVRHQEGDTMLFVQLYSGVKLPTGDTDRLREEQEEENERGLLRHGSEEGNLVGGDDLTIGSGSTDVIFGLGFLLRKDRYFVDGDVQYALRTEGDYDFEFGDEVAWSVGTGVYLYLEHETSWALRAKLSGESKQGDELQGQELSGSAHDRVYLGPEIVSSFDDHWELRFGLDIPIKRNSTSEGVEPDYRLQAGASYWFS